ncbi:MAG: DNA polymerase I [Rickettsiales bacterium]|jgi:DNA polymerase-1|nr:DNA polymerase I [Rickettsiales bacterium]
MRDKKLILVDGYSFFFRAYFALKNIKKRSDGLAVNGIYGFTRMLVKLIVDLKSTHIAVVFDTGGKNFRHSIFPEYKSNRPPVPEDMVPQFPFIREVTEAMNIKTIEKYGYEADDIIATLTAKAKSEGYEVWIISGDKDLAQLIEGDVFLYDAKDNRKIDADDIFEKWGVYPNQILGVLSLMGDASDNVPGIPSIGQKTAVKLIREFGALDNLVANLDRVKPDRIRTTLENNMDKLLLSRQLVTLCDTVDIPLSIEDLVFRNFNPARFIEFLRRMEFNSIAKEIEKNFGGTEGEMFPARSRDYEYKKITDLDMLDRVCRDLVDSNDRIVFHLRTGNNSDYEDVKTICFSDENKKHIYFICLIDGGSSDDLLDLSFSDNHLSFSKVARSLRIVLEDRRILKISYNIKKQMRIFKRFGLDIVNYDDVGLMSYILDNGKFEHSLAGIIEEYLCNNVQFKFDDIEGSRDIIHRYERGTNLDSLGISDKFAFFCGEIEILRALHGLIDERLSGVSELRELYESIEKPLVNVLADMEWEGVRVDVGGLMGLSEHFQGELLRIEDKIHREVGQEFNINSPKQVGEILFEKMHLPLGKKSRNSGHYSTDTEVLDDLYRMGFSIAGDILEYRHYMKLKSTYTDVLPRLIDRDGRVHTSFSNTYVITGRLSSSSPNLQNIPIRTEDGEKIRKTFISREGFSFIGADYSQIELRILAQYANVKHLLESFRDGRDVHAETARRVFKTDTVTPDMRRLAKVINFSIVYGTTPFGLAKRLSVSNNEARDYMDNYFRVYPEIMDYMNQTKEAARKQGFVKTMFNRICYVDMSHAREPQRSFLERLTINAPIQGTGADIIKKAMVMVHKNIADFNARIVLQVHDELLVESNDSCVAAVKDVVQNTMENVVKFQIPLPVDIKIGKNWSEAH